MEVKHPRDAPDRSTRTMPINADIIGRIRRRGAANTHRPPRDDGIRYVSWRDVGEAVRRNRALRQQTQADYAREVGISIRVIGKLESGEPQTYDASTISKVELALGWAHGSVERVVEGANPVEEVDQLFARVRNAWPRLSSPSRRTVASLAADLAYRDGRPE